MNDFGDYRTWKAWHGEAFGQVTPAQDHYFKAEMERSLSGGTEAISVLEIGFGNGSFAAWATRRGWDYRGTELDPELVARAAAVGLATHAASTRISDIVSPDSLDAVIVFDVFEHLMLTEIADLLIAVRDRLKPTGRVIARFPSGDSPFSRSIQYGDMTHRSVIGSGIVKQIALKTGFHIVQMRAPVLPVYGLGATRMFRRVAIHVGRAAICQLLRTLYFDGQPRVVEPNMLVVLEPAS